MLIIHDRECSLTDRGCLMTLDVNAQVQTPDDITIDPLSRPVEHIVGFWMCELRIEGVRYHRRTHREYRRERSIVVASIRRQFYDRIKQIVTSGEDRQWLIHNLTDTDYPFLVAALREAGLFKASWSRNASMAIVYRDGLLQIWQRNMVRGRRSEKYFQYEISPPV